MGIWSFSNGVPVSRLARWLMLGLQVVGVWAALGSPLAAAQSVCEAPRPISKVERTVERMGAVLERAVVGNADRLARDWQNEDTHISYRLDVSLPAECQLQGRRVLWVYRIGAPYRIRIDGLPAESIEPFAAQATSMDTVYNGRVPALFALPPGAKRVDIALATIPYVPSGLMDLQTGSQASMGALFAFHYAGILQVNELSSAVIFAIAVLGFTIWLARRKEWAVLLFAGACLAWSLRGFFYQQFVLSLPPLVIEQVNPLFAMLTGVCLTASLMGTLKIMTRARAVTLLGVALVTITALTVAHLSGHGARPVRLAVFFMALLMLSALPVMVWHYGGHLGKGYRGLLAFGFSAALAGAVHDIMLVTGPILPSHWSFITPGFTLLLVCYAAASAQFFASSLNRAEYANEELEQAIGARTAQLDTTYALLGDRDREAGRLQEREHLLREMHDGIGAQLVTALRGIERGALQPQQVVQSLQDSLDELRMLMDSTDVSAYLPSALAAWRNRWDAKLAAAGVALEWHLDDSLDAIALSGDANLQVMRILQEAAANVVKHSRAQRMTLNAKVVDQNDRKILLIQITDDGVGLSQEGSRAGARGIKNMLHRAAEMGGQVTITSPVAPLTGCDVVLTVPL